LCQSILLNQQDQWIPQDVNRQMLPLQFMSNNLKIRLELNAFDSANVQCE